jgi:putative restriction endonuclease
LTFENWMQRNGLSESSIKKYRSALAGPLSDWVNEAGIHSSNLMGITEALIFANVINQLKSGAIFLQRNTTGNGMYSSALSHYHAFLLDQSFSEMGNDLTKIVSDQSDPITRKMQMICARIGQGQFRADLINFWGKCSVTGYRETSLLMASHIKPWSMSSDKERLDKYNGLLLLPNLDRAFDRGLISFGEDGMILISSSLSFPGSLGIDAGMHIELMKEHKDYLRFHREQRFQP